MNSAGAGTYSCSEVALLIWDESAPQTVFQPVLQQITDVDDPAHSSVRTCLGFSSSIRLMKSPFSRQPSHSWKNLYNSDGQCFYSFTSSHSDKIFFRSFTFSFLRSTVLKSICFSYVSSQIWKVKIDLKIFRFIFKLWYLANLSVGLLQLFANLVAGMMNDMKSGKKKLTLTTYRVVFLTVPP